MRQTKKNHHDLEKGDKGGHVEDGGENKGGGDQMEDQGEYEEWQYKHDMEVFETEEELALY